MRDTEQSAALHALLGYGQADEDGVMCIVSRQAVHEVADELTAIRALNAELVEGLRKAEQAGDFQRVLAAYRAVRRAALSRAQTEKDASS